VSIEALMCRLTDENWAAAFAWERKEPALVIVNDRTLINRELRSILERLREIAAGLSKYDTTILCRLNAGMPILHANTLIEQHLVSCAPPDGAYFLRPFGRAVLYVLLRKPTVVP
jgi:hypothetical protein